jgi:NAD(P)-dependent dehydrogenase (short-subunit alcohol dehydrogenase family)
VDLQLTGQNAVVIGGGNGIGRAIAAEFAAEKANVVLIDRNPEVAEIAKSLADRAEIPVHSYLCDATDSLLLQRVASQIAERCGPSEHLVYAAGVGSGKFGFPYWNLQPSDWPRVLDVNLLGAVNMAHVFRQPLIERRRGTMLFIASIAGQIGSQTDPPYSAAKAALINFAQCAAKDLAAYNVRVNTICPGMIKTALNRAVWQAWHDQQPVESRQSYEEWASEKVKRVAPLGRWQTCEDVAALAVFLASPRAQNITGQTLNVDGGQVMHW